MSVVTLVSTVGLLVVVSPVDSADAATTVKVRVRTAVRNLPVASGCDIQRGRWYSYYDAKTFTRSSGLDIDHLVPLAEAWDSGARRWTADTRQRYANDLGDPRSLLAVSASTNRSKGDQDPAQ